MLFFEIGLYGVITLLSVYKKSSTLRSDTKVSQENRVEIHIITAEVGNPCNIIKGRNKEVSNALFSHNISKGSQFIGSRASCIFFSTYIDRLPIVLRAFFPYLLNKRLIYHSNILLLKGITQ